VNRGEKGRSVVNRGEKGRSVVNRREKGRSVVNRIMNFSLPLIAGNFLTWKPFISPRTSLLMEQ